ncbi:predicted protein [Naegleria gruberi]|uniref:Predicted protein n=1 Tax=Naegleria gruberi TaxID=5762 RepID=D2W4A8_NAEGR|nr:uncharacterized protein NAEGRDRAFT_76238 [Naegleria gruberi]EFC36096.1 predicted protein [Naegleria gruberi]|eukprot:XP_002668840.1 predicted protein [Naegleria gruberi strain NEG-M]
MNSVVMKDSHVIVSEDEGSVEILNLIPPNTNIADVSDAHISIEDCIFDCPYSIVQIKTNGGEVVLNNVAINCKQLVIESTVFGKILIGRGSQIQTREGIELLCGGGDTVIDENVQMFIGGKMFCYNIPYSPLIKDEDGSIVALSLNPITQQSRLIVLDNSDIKVNGMFLSVGSAVILGNAARISTGLTLLESKSVVVIQGEWTSEKMKIISPLCTINGNLISTTDIVFNSPSVISFSEIRCKQDIIFQSVSNFVNKGSIKSKDITGWNDSKTGSCLFENHGVLELQHLTVKTDQEDEGQYNILIINKENANISIKGITKFISNKKEGSIYLVNEGTIYFMGDFKTLLQEELGDIHIENTGKLSFLSSLNLFGTSFNSYNELKVNGKTKLLLKCSSLSGKCNFLSSFVATCDNFTSSGQDSVINFTDAIFFICSDMSTMSKLNISGSLIINMSTSDPLSFLNMNNQVVVGKNVTICAPNLISDDLTFSQNKSNENNIISVINTHFNGILQCKGNIYFQVKEVGEFNSSIFAECSEFNIGKMKGSLTISGTETSFSVDQLFGHLSINMKKSATLKINQYANKKSTININAKKVNIENKGKQESKKVKIRSVEDILTKFSKDVESKVDVESETGTVVHNVGGKVSGSHDIKANRVIMICDDAIEAPTKIKATDSANLEVARGIMSHVEMEGSVVNLKNKSDQDAKVVLYGNQVTVDSGNINDELIVTSSSMTNLSAKDLIGTIRSNNIQKESFLQTTGESANIKISSNQGKMDVNSKNSTVKVTGDMDGHLLTSGNNTFLDLQEVKGVIDSANLNTDIIVSKNLIGSLNTSGVDSTIKVTGNVVGSVLSSSSQTNISTNNILGTVLTTNQNNTLNVSANNIGGSIDSSSKQTTIDASLLGSSGSISTRGGNTVLSFNKSIDGKVTLHGNSANVTTGMVKGEIDSSALSTQIHVLEDMTGDITTSGDKLVLQVDRSMIGNITSKSLENEVEIANVAGNISVEGKQSSLKLENLSGNLTSKSGATGVVVRNDMGGKMSIQGDSSHLKLGILSGNLNIDSSNNDMSIENLSGTITESSNISQATIEQLTGDFKSKAKESTVVVERELSGNLNVQQTKVLFL